MKKLFVTNQVPKGATILVVDIEEHYFEEVLEYLEQEEQDILKERIRQRLGTVKETLLSFKEAGHTIIATNTSEIYPGFFDLPDEFLPQWNWGVEQDRDEEDEGGSYLLHPAIHERMKQEEMVIVCGLWKELCCYVVARKLQEELEEKVLLYVGEDLTLENAMMSLDDDVLTLEDVCVRDGVTAIYKK